MKSNKTTVNWAVLEERAKRRIKNNQEFKERTTFLRNEGSAKSPLALIPALAQSLISLFQDISMSGGKLHTKMCDNYGHVIEGQAWSYQGIKCRDCGKTVSSPDELRKAVPMSQKSSKSAK